MTNYEWLCKENKLVEFLFDVSSSSIHSTMEKWHIIKTPAFWLEDVRDWLQSKHKEPTKWVRMDDVQKAFKRGVEFNEFQTSFTSLQLVSTVAENVRMILNDINKLETKEIEDE